jgi:hypothetical protein
MSSLISNWAILVALEVTNVCGGGLQMIFGLQKKRNNVWGLNLLWVLKCSLTSLSNLVVLLFCSLVTASITCSYIYDMSEGDPYDCRRPHYWVASPFYKSFNKAHTWISWRSNRWNLKFNLIWSLVLLLSKTHGDLTNGPFILTILF